MRASYHMSKTLVRYLLGLACIGVWCLEGCVPDDGPEPDLIVDGLIIPNASRAVDLGDPPFQLDLIGLSLDESTSEVRSQGVFTGFVDITTSTDTTEFSVDPADVTWSSSNTSVATVSAGEVTIVGEGIAGITASTRDVVSNTFNVAVTVPLVAPVLTIDPPEREVVFTDIGVFSGSVTIGSILTIAGESVDHDSDGRFTATVENLVLGENTITVVAANPNDPSLQTTATKVFVREPQVAPELNIDPPLRVLVFGESGTISGTVTPGANLTVGGVSENYDSEGNFFTTVGGLVVGENEVQVVAVNPDDASLQTAASKFFIREMFGPDASIVGNWRGTTLGLDFPFEVRYNADGERYDLTGTMSIDFQGFGVVEDIRIEGIVNADGSIDATLSFDNSGIRVSGDFRGFFSDDGTALGNYGAQLRVGGVRIADAEFDWTAIKLD